MADVKALLKEARKLIDDKDYKNAQECCKNILRKDKQNYFGLVLLGKSLQDSEQAPLAFQKAIACKSDHPLAWQGLANYYEKCEDEESKYKLISVYEEMLNLQLDDDKMLEILIKIRQLSSLKSSHIISILLKLSTKDMATPVQESAKNLLFELLKEETPISKEDVPSVLGLLETNLNNNANDFNLQVIYAKIIIKHNNFITSVEKIVNLNFYSKNLFLKELMCIHICKKYIEDNSFDDFNVESHLDKIIDGIENNKYAGFLKSIIALNKGLLVEAYEICVPLINYNQPNEIEANLIIKCTAMLKKWTVTQKLANNFLTKMHNPIVRNQLKKHLFLAFAKQKRWKEAIDAITDIPIDTFNELELVLLGECYIENQDPALHIIERLHSTEHSIALKALTLLKQQKFYEAITLIENDNMEYYLHKYYLGVSYWELQQYDKCLINLLKAAKLDPYFANTFLYLGYYYKGIEDLDKAKKCYEKAYSLDNYSLEIARNLSDTYIQLQLLDADLELLQQIEKNNKSNAYWVNFRLGLHLLNKKDWDNAISNFCHVIKNKPDDVKAFECLADGYYYRGSYLSALKAYNKAIALCPKNTTYCLIQIGYIYSLLTQYDEAITTFKLVLKDNPMSILTLKGISETWMRVANKKLTSKMYGGARDCAQQAIAYITQALTASKDFSCLWKILGDTFMFMTKLPEKYAYAYLTNYIGDISDGNVKLNKLDLFPHAIACYARIAKLKNEYASYDLALAYFRFYKESMTIAHCQISFSLTKECIKKRPAAWRNWNLLGKIYFNVDKLNFAQHCFIKSLLATRKWSIAEIWCNLGTLYLKLKVHKLANYCFWRGQSTLPSYPQSWIGQALIAEAIREEEAMDLFRHASRLGYHRESALGYADWVCRTLKRQKADNPEMKYIIEGLHAVPYAIDLMEWYSNFEPDDACASTILGILQEKYGLLHSALHSFQKALNNVDDSKKSIALLNIGRVLLRLGNYDDAIITFKSVPEASMDSACGLALSLYRKGIYEEAYAAYDMALHWLCSDENEKSHLLVAMAGIVYTYKTPDDAKTLLFQSIQTSSNISTAYSLFAICSLGLLQTDQSLSKLAISELQKYDKDMKFNYDIGFLKSYMLICEDRVKDALKVLSESLMNYPNNTDLWFCMAQYCLRTEHPKVGAASSSAQRALCCAQDGQFHYDAAKMLATASVAEHLAGNHMHSLLIAKRGLHIYPQQAEIWAALVFSLLTNKFYIERKQWLLDVAIHMRRHLKISRVLSRWITLVEKRLSKMI